MARWYNDIPNIAMSTKSNTPPIPGKKDPESFTWQSRLIKDSDRSPNSANIPIASPKIIKRG